MPSKPFNYLKFILICLAVIIILFVVLVVFSVQNQPSDQLQTFSPKPTSTQSQITPGVVSIRQDQSYYPSADSNSPVLGKLNAPVTIYEFADFGCQYSAKMQPVINDIMKKYDGKIKLVFKDSPTDGSALAHLAARCAQKQNKFWEYGNLLWQNQKDFSDQHLTNLAKELGMNLDNFNDCLKKQIPANLVTKDAKEADDLNIFGTPHFYINDQELLGISSEADFSKIIDSELKK